MKILLMCIMALSASLAASAQDGLEPITAGQTSTARSSGSSTFGEDIYNVDLYSGSASVTIPIYSYSAENMNFGISLGYDARGVKVD